MKKEIQTRLIRHLTFLEKELGDLCSLSSVLRHLFLFELPP